MSPAAPYFHRIVARSGRDDRQQHREGQHDRERGAQHPRQAGAEPAQVARAALRGEQRQHRGGQRHGDHRVRHHHDEEGLRVHGVAGGVDRAATAAAAAEHLRGAARGQVDHDGVRDLVDHHEQHGPDAQAQGVAEAGAAEVEPRPVVEAGRPQERHEHQQLDGDPGGRAQAEPGLLGRRVRRALGVVGDGAVVDEVGDQDRDRDEVVGDRRPHHRAEPAPGVEHLPDQREHPVEEHLRQAEPRERDDRVALRGQLGLVVLRGQEHVHHPRRGHDQHHGDRCRGTAPTA